MGARHRARAHSIQIMKVQVIAANKCRRPAIKQFHVSPRSSLCVLTLLLWAALSLDCLPVSQLRFKKPPDKKPDSSSRFPASIFKPGGSETGDRRWVLLIVNEVWLHQRFETDHDLLSDSCRTPRSSSLCPTGSCVASTNPASPPRDQTPSTKSILSFCAGKNKNYLVDKEPSLFIHWFVLHNRTLYSVGWLMNRPENWSRVSESAHLEQRHFNCDWTESLTSGPWTLRSSTCWPVMAPTCLWLISDPSVICEHDRQKQKWTRVASFICVLMLQQHLSMSIFTLQITCCI